MGGGQLYSALEMEKIVHCKLIYNSTEIRGFSQHIALEKNFKKFPIIFI